MTHLVAISSSWLNLWEAWMSERGDGDPLNFVLSSCRYRRIVYQSLLLSFTRERLQWR
jgi:hypothetical protein